MDLPGLIRQAGSVALVSHIHPDGDAVGSLLALHLGLEQLDKPVRSALQDGVPAVFTFLKGSQKISQELAPADLVVILDTPVFERLGFTLPAAKLALLDHHPLGDIAPAAQASLHDQKSSSTAELVYQLLVDLGVKFTPEISTALLLGIYTDTGAFQFSNTTDRTLAIVSELMRRGGQLQQIVNQISRSKSLAHLKLLGLALERLKPTLTNRALVSVLAYPEIQLAQAGQVDLNGIINNLNLTSGYRFCLLLIEDEPGQIRGELRTGEGFKTNVRSLARLLGGGGHPVAAGFSITGKLIQQGNNWKIVA